MVCCMITGLPLGCFTVTGLLYDNWSAVGQTLADEAQLVSDG